MFKKLHLWYSYKAWINYVKRMEYKLVEVLLTILKVLMLLFKANLFWLFLKLSPLLNISTQ